jgi:hypothetical protein
MLSAECRLAARAPQSKASKERGDDTVSRALGTHIQLHLLQHPDHLLNWVIRLLLQQAVAHVREERGDVQILV